MAGSGSWPAPRGSGRHPSHWGPAGWGRAPGAWPGPEGQPVVSVDTKKKELVGNYHNGGREWRPKGDPVHVKDHDFPDLELGKAIPYGIYDLAADTGWVNVGTDHDTAAFAVE